VSLAQDEGEEEANRLAPPASGETMTAFRISEPIVCRKYCNIVGSAYSCFHPGLAAFASLWEETHAVR
jgi:hypothetical protein